MGQLFSLPLPLQGVNRYHARSDQPASTCEDALNVFPFDRWGRARIGQRPGTGQLWDDAIGSSNPIQMIQQTAIGLATDTSFDVLLAEEKFTYSDGNLDTVSGGLWATVNDPTSPTVATTNVVASDVLSSGATGRFSRLVADPLNGVSSYFISLDFILPVTLETNADYGAIIMRGNDTINSTNDFLKLIVSDSSGTKTVQLQNKSGLITPGSGNASATVTLTASTTYNIKIVWNGDAYEVFLNSTSIFSGTTTAASGQSRVGIYTKHSTGGSKNTTWDNFKVGRSYRSAVTRETDVIAVANGSVYMGNPGTQATLAASGSSVVDADSIPSGAVLFGKMYLTDGGNDLAVLDIATKTVSTWSSSAGDETATTLGAYTIAVPWRGRLVLGHDKESPQNFIVSKVGDPTNFDLTGTGPDTAYAGNAAKSGQISDPITALIPWTEDTLVIGTDHGIHAMRGDISDGGSLDLISDAIGILSQTAWCKSPDGTLYFVGTTGFFAWPPGSEAPVNLTDKTYNQFFKLINRKTMYVNLAWDRDRHGCFIFVTPVVSGTATHLYFDARNGGFWPMQYPDSHGPVSCCVYDGDDPTDRYLLMGGRTGLVQIQSDVDRTDNGTKITSYVLMGPYQPLGPTADCIVTGLDLTAGEVFTGDATSDWNMNWTIKGGKTAYEVTEGTQRTIAAGNLATAGWQNTRVPRIRGSFISVKLSNSNSGDYFSIESANLSIVPGGKTR